MHYLRADIQGLVGLGSAQQLGNVAKDTGSLPCRPYIIPQLWEKTLVATEVNVGQGE